MSRLEMAGMVASLSVEKSSSQEADLLVGMAGEVGM